MYTFLGVNIAIRRAGWVKLANRQAGYLSSLSLIRAGGAQRESCSARLSGYRRKGMHCPHKGIDQPNHQKFGLIFLLPLIPFPPSP
ncbi:hypothetical protein FOB42_16490 [Bordetella bronchiseptica]|nr:hypothetical protein FOB42_16490 [Bordetella bronchiseptica]